PAGGARPAFGRGGFAGGPGGDGGGAADPALIAYLTAHRGGATWLVATDSANSGASLQLATGAPVLAMGGFSGGDAAMTVARLQELVSSGQLRYVLAGGGPGGRGGGFGGPAGAGPAANGDAQSVNTWITQHCLAI